MNHQGTVMHFRSIGLGSDHAGFPLKEQIKSFLQKQNLEVRDFGCPDPQDAKVDYPDFCLPLASWVVKDSNRGGIAICGSGVGMAMCANKVRSARAAAVYTVELAKLSRLHNNSNLLCLGARMNSTSEALEMVEAWLATGFEGGRHFLRIGKFNELGDFS